MKKEIVLLSLLLVSCNSSSSMIVSEKDPIEVEERWASENIYGKLYIPEQKSNEIVILSHSAFLTNDSLSSYAYGFAKRGYYAYAFDFCGGSYSSKSKGNMKDMTIFTEVDNLKTVINNFIDFDKIYLFGTSQGGLVTALSANDINVNGQILLYPAFNIPDEVKNYNSSFSPLGEDYIKTIKDYDVYAHIGNFTNRVLIIHGDKDTTVDISYSKKALDVYKNCSLNIISGAGHGFNKDNFSLFKDYDNEVWKSIDDYFKGEAND